MVKLFILFCCTLMIACTNNTSSPDNSKAASLNGTKTNATQGWSKQEELEFMDGCVANAQSRLGEQQAFALCKCILGQVQEKFSAADSIAIATHLSDTAQITGMMQKCK